eukprot:1869690-Prymnesium_polylepis.1
MQPEPLTTANSGALGGGMDGRGGTGDNGGDGGRNGGAGGGLGGGGWDTLPCETESWRVSRGA